MQRIKIFLTVFVLIFAFACSSQDKNTENAENDTVKIVATDTVVSDTVQNRDEATEGLGKEYTSKYICPMHCKGSGSDKPGTCPVCGMEYIENPDYQ